MAKLAQPIFVFKVALADGRNIWRKIAMRGNQTLDDLHDAIFGAFDRYDEHLYSFYFPPPGTKKLTMSKVRDYRRCGAPAPCADEGPFADPGLPNAAETPVASLNLKPKQLFFYLFDFGDEWWHEITVEAIDAPEEKGKYPRVIDTHHDSPPQYPDNEDYDDEDDE
jgi:hypothetical protein